MTARGWGRIFVAVRYQPQNPAWFTESYAGLCQHGLREGDARDFVYSKTMHKAANLLVRKFLQTDCDSICFIDSDAVFGTGALTELRDDAQGWDYDVLQAFTVKRGWPPEPMYLTEMPDQPESDDKYRGRHMVTNLPLYDDFIYPVDAVSLHFTLIRRALLERMIGENGTDLTYWFEYREDNGEDITFSWNARQAGAKLGMTTKLKIGHVSEGVHGWNTMLDYYYYKFLHESGALPTPGMDLFASYFNAQRSLSELVAAYTGEDVETVYQKSCAGSLATRDQWKVKQPQTADDVRAFYGTTPQYFYDLIKWNASPPYQKILSGLVNVRGERILEIGGGLGTTTEFLVTLKNTVDYYDVPGVLREFATWRFGRWNGHTASVRVIERWEMNTYDRVVAIDVLEHVHPAEFGMLADLLCLALKPGGILFAHNNWSTQDGMYPFHFDNSDAFAKALERNDMLRTGEYTWRKDVDK